MKVNRGRKTEWKYLPRQVILTTSTPIKWYIEQLNITYQSIPLSVSFQTIPCKTTLVPGSHEPNDDSSVTDDWSTVLGCVWWLLSFFNDSLLVIVSLFVGRGFFFKERNEWIN